MNRRSSKGWKSRFGSKSGGSIFWKQGMLVTFLKCFQYSTFAFQTALQDEWAANHLRHIGPTEMSDWRFDLSQAFKLPTGAFWLLLTCFKRPKKFWVYFPYLRPLLSRTEIGSATELLAARCSDWVGQWISMNQWMWLAPLKPCTAKAVAIWMSCTDLPRLSCWKKKRIRSRETIKGDHVFKFPLFEEIHFDSFQKPWFSFAGQTDESWWYFPQLSCSVWERWHLNNCRRTLIQVYSVEPWRSSAVHFIDQSHFTAASVV